MCYARNMLQKVIIGALILILGFFGFRFIQSNPSQYIQENQQESTGFGSKTPFYNKNGIYLTHSWPGEGNFSDEETEILVFNESSSNLEVKSFDLAYTVENKIYPHKSGTWEKFPSRESWDRIEYINIAPQYYKNELLSLTPGQKGKLHWHIQFGSQPLDGKQTIQLKLTLLKGNETITIDEQFHRDSSTVVSRDEH